MGSPLHALWRARLLSLVGAIFPLLLLTATWAQWQHRPIGPAVILTSWAWLVSLLIHRYAHILVARVLHIVALSAWRWSPIGEIGHLVRYDYRLGTIAEVLAGPCGSLLVASVAAITLWAGIQSLSQTMTFLALASALVGLLNLFPALGTDGDRLFAFVVALLRGEFRPRRSPPFPARVRTLAIALLWFTGSLVLVQRGGMLALAGCWLAWASFALWRTLPLAEQQAAVSLIGWDTPAIAVATRAVRVASDENLDQLLPRGVGYALIGQPGQPSFRLLRVPPALRSFHTVTLRLCEPLSPSQWIDVSGEASLAEVCVALWDSRAVAVLVRSAEGWGVVDHDVLAQLVQQLGQQITQDHANNPVDHSATRTLQ
ncbi:MAG: M50 family metallopeptidase [Thermorudis peleae]|nr:M50 family metallopeptidase [Thermorudis peleae]